ncbi:hypothetical protein PPACK8108_LOCUS24481, partial [Phakopsora pachyrhizi]
MIILSCNSNRGQWNTVMGTLRNSKSHGSFYIYDYKNSFLPSNDSNTNRNDDQIIVCLLTLKVFSTQRDFCPLGIDI